MSNNTNYEISMPTTDKLRGMANWPEWSTKVQLALVSMGLWGHVKGEVIRPTDDATDWVKNDSKAIFFMINNMTETTQQKLKQAGWDIDNATAMTTWNLLKTSVTKITDESLADLLMRFPHYKRKDFATFNAYIAKTLWAWDTIIKAGGLDDKFLVMTLMNGIKDTYPEWYTNWKHDCDRGKFPTKQDFLQFLSAKADDEEAAGTRINLSVQTPNQLPPMPAGAKGSDQCYIHTNMTHSNDNCWSQHPEKRPSWHKGKRKGKSPNQVGNPDIIQPMNLAIVARALSSDAVVLDSGAAEHCFNDLKWFAHIDFHDEDNRYIGHNNVPYGRQGIGIVQLSANGKILILHNVGYCAVGTANIIATNILEKSYGLVVNGQTKELVFADSGHKLCSYEWQSGVAVLDVRPQSKPHVNFSVLPNRATTKNVDYGLMHHRLMHAGAERIKRACKAAGIQLNESSIKKFHCEACYLGKADAIISRAKFEPTAFLSHVYWDLLQHTPVGYRWSLHGIDGYTGFQWIMFLTRKKHALPKLKEWKGKVEKMSGGHQVQAFVFDNGGEFKSDKTTEWGTKEEVKIKYTTPYAHEQNGRAEKAGKDIAAGARTTLIQLQLPQELWPLFMETSVYIHNLLPARRYNWQSPIQRMFKIINLPYEPSLRHIHTWGCKAYVTIPKETQVKSQKMANKAKIGNLVGMEGLHGHVYKIWLPDEQRVVRARDVRFHEGPNNKTRTDPTIEYEAKLVEPDPEGSGKITYTEVRDELGTDLGGKQTEEHRADPSGTITPETHSTDRSSLSPDIRLGTPLESPHSMLSDIDVVEQLDDSGASQRQHEQLHQDAGPIRLAPTDVDKNPRSETPRNNLQEQTPPYTPAQQYRGNETQTRNQLALEEQEDLQQEQPIPPARAMHGTFSEKQDVEDTASEQPMGQGSVSDQHSHPSQTSHRSLRDQPRRDYSDNGATIAAERAAKYVNLIYREEDIRQGQAKRPLIPMWSIMKIREHLNQPRVPKNWFDARVRNDYKSKWLPAMEKQFRSLVEMDVWILVELPPGKIALDGRWVYDEKYPKDADPYARARWVVRELCLFRRDDGVHILLYVDDMIIAAPTKQMVKDTAESIALRFKIKEIGEVTEFLGLEIKRDRPQRRIWISQEKFIDRIIQKFFPDQQLNKAQSPWPSKTEIPANWKELDSELSIHGDKT
ncbi:Retrovirus-related Pol polyprotein from transposon RE1 [Metarhizium anisopliae]|nr:Retrovirus-related Pol polyprotein from transposon RE1 [Metarhizium anisopliae]